MKHLILCQDLNHFEVAPNTPIRELLAKLDRQNSDLAVVVSEEKKLLGIITDGDMRRALLKRANLLNPASEIMMTRPFTAPTGLSANEYLEMLYSRKVRHIPILDNQDQLIDLALLERLAPPVPSESAAVIMAGGLGSRLGELTRSTPKPLLPVGNEPILGRILRSLKGNGIQKAYLCVNHLADQIMDYVGDGSAWGVQVNYVHETRRMGTAGALSLLPDEAKAVPFIVMNGDIVSWIRYINLLAYHRTYGYDLTVCVTQYDIQVPFGVIEADGPLVRDIKEQPVQNFFINAGIYVMNPELLGLIPQGEPADMPSVIQRAIQTGKRIGCFPIREYWVDVGTPTDLSRANQDLNQ